MTHGQETEAETAPPEGQQGKIPEAAEAPGARDHAAGSAELELKRIQHDLDLLGPSPSGQAAKNRAVCFLLRVCLELERPE